MTNSNLIYKLLKWELDYIMVKTVSKEIVIQRNKSNMAGEIADYLNCWKGNMEYPN